MPRASAAATPPARWRARRAPAATPPPSSRPVAPAFTAALLSGSLGGGHDALAAACAGLLEAEGATTHTADVITSLGQGGPARAADWLFRQLLGSMPAYDAFHFSQLRDGGLVGAAAERAGVLRATPFVRRELDRELGAPVDVAVSVFATAAGVASRLKATGHVARSVVFVPDAYAHRMWVHANTDLFLVTSRLGAASVRRYRPEAPVEILDPPLRVEFAAPPAQQEARQALELPADGDVILVMGGAWGLGPVVQSAIRLADAGRYVLAVAGRNATLLGQLRSAAVGRPRLRPLGYCTNVAELMSASDLVVTTAGMTCHEARAVGRGLVLLDVVPGHGRENLSHELERGAAAVSQPDADTVSRTVSVCLGSAEYRAPAPTDVAAAGRRFLEALAGVGALAPARRSSARPA